MKKKSYGYGYAPEARVFKKDFERAVERARNEAQNLSSSTKCRARRSSKGFWEPLQGCVLTSTQAAHFLVERYKELFNEPPLNALELQILMRLSIKSKNVVRLKKNYYAVPLPA